MAASSPQGAVPGTREALQRQEAVRLLLQRAELLEQAGQHRSVSQARIDAQEFRTGKKPPRPSPVETPPSRIDQLLQTTKPPITGPRKAGKSMEATNDNATPKPDEPALPESAPVDPVRQVQFREATASAPGGGTSRALGQEANPGDAPEPVRTGTLNTEDLFRFPTNLH